VKPVLKLIVIASGGAILARRGISHISRRAFANIGHLTSAVLKGMSATVINVFLPCLLFSKTIPTFTTDNLGPVGVLILTAALYQCFAYT
jgi:auxin efflux carrier family protein